MSKFLFDPKASEAAYREHFQRHDELARKIRFAILDAFDPRNERCVEEKLKLVDPVAFRLALADVAAELVGWNFHGDADRLIEDVRRFCELDDENDPTLL
jgi:hypothetical protein